MNKLKPCPYCGKLIYGGRRMTNKELLDKVCNMSNQIEDLRIEREETDKALAFVMDSWWETLKDVRHVLLQEAKNE